jgi:hypothetical protein
VPASKWSDITGDRRSRRRTFFLLFLIQSRQKRLIEIEDLCRPTAEQSSIPQSTDECLLSLPRGVRAVCLFLRAKEEISTARKVGQIIARAGRRWLIRVYLGRDDQTKRRKYHIRTIHAPCERRMQPHVEVAINPLHTSRVEVCKAAGFAGWHECNLVGTTPGCHG